MKIVKIKNNNSNLAPYSPMRSMLDDFFSTASLMDGVLNQTFTSKNLFVDVWEEDDNFFVKMAMPGVDKDSIEISTTADTVTIKGRTKEDKKEEVDKRRYYYRTMEGVFEQTFNLPTRVDSDNAQASYEDGVLTLTLPKSDEVKPRKIEIN